MDTEYKVEIGGESYVMSELYSASITQPLFEKFSVGNACSAELNLVFSPKGAISRMAKVVPFARRSESDDWVQLGVFFIDTRKKNGVLLDVTAYDAMLKAETVWEPDPSLSFPLGMPAAVDVFCGILGVSLDSRSTINSEYSIDYPANEYTVRDILRYIAAAHGGNWIITAGNKLLLVPLFDSVPAEPAFLADESGDAITVGGEVILL